MGGELVRRNAKRDANEREIINALEMVGCEVWQINQEELPDLLVVRAGQITLLEVKDKGGKLTEGQRKSRERGLPFQIVTQPLEALHAVGIRLEVTA